MSTEAADSMIPSHQLSQEAYHFLKIFPSEVWNIIIKKLDTASLISLSNSSQFFRNILKEKQIDLLFPPVLKILLPYLFQYFGASTKDFMFLRQGHPQAEQMKAFILNLRLGCPSWNKAIQDLFSISSHTETCPELELLVVLINKPYNFCLSSQTTAFLENFTESHASTKSNPFLGRRLLIMRPMPGGRFGRGGDQQVFYTQIPQILQTFGHHLWKLELHLCWNFRTEQQRHLKTVELINYLPQLRKLHIVFGRNVFADNLAEDIVSFPNLPDLKNLKCHDWPASSFNMFVRQNPQISHLTMLQFTLEHRYDLSPLVNLEYLNISLFSVLEQQAILENPQLKFPRLQNLELQYRTYRNGSGDEEFARWSSVFQMLSQKLPDSENFEELNLQLPQAVNEEDKRFVFEDSVNERLVLKNIKRLTLAFNDSTTGIDFILGVKETLEELKVKLDLDDMMRLDNQDVPNYLVELDKRNEIFSRHYLIKFVGFKSKMRESNIWDLMPALKRIELVMNPSCVKEYVRE